MGIKGVVDNKGISDQKLSHIMLGEVDDLIVKGFHHECYTYKDTLCETYDCKVFSYYYGKTDRVYKATVVKINTSLKKTSNQGQSTFFPMGWSRQNTPNTIVLCPISCTYTLNII